MEVFGINHGPVPQEGAQDQSNWLGGLASSEGTEHQVPKGAAKKKCFPPTSRTAATAR